MSAVLIKLLFAHVVVVIVVIVVVVVVVVIVVVALVAIGDFAVLRTVRQMTLK